MRSLRTRRPISATIGALFDIVNPAVDGDSVATQFHADRTHTGQHNTDRTHTEQRNTDRTHTGQRNADWTHTGQRNADRTHTGQRNADRTHVALYAPAHLPGLYGTRHGFRASA